MIIEFAAVEIRLELVLNDREEPFLNRTPLNANETYQSVEFWGSCDTGKHFPVLACVTYHFNQRKSQAPKGDKSEPCDIASMDYYSLFIYTCQLGDKLLAQIAIAGVGDQDFCRNYKSGERPDVQESPNNFQFGTASTNLTFSIPYATRYNDSELILTLIIR